MDLWSLKEQIATKLLKELPDDQRLALEAAMRGVGAFMALPDHAFDGDQTQTKGEIGQKIADALVPLVMTSVPGLEAYKAVVTLFEPHIGEAIDFLTSLAPMEVTDKQSGPVVHDEGQDAPVV